MENAFCIPCHPIHINGVTAMAFEPHIDIGFVGIAPRQNIKDSAFCRNHRKDSVVICHQASQRFAGTIICKETDRLQLRCLIQLFLQILQFQLHFPVCLTLQLFLQLLLIHMQLYYLHSTLF